MTTSVAVFVDGDNVSPSHAPEILNSARSLGALSLARVFVNSVALPAWQAVPGIRTMVSGPKAGATDMCLALDALEYALLHPEATLLVASSDGDFVPLVLRLRELGRTVVGLGEDKSPQTLTAAYARFNFLPALPAKKSAQKQSQSAGAKRVSPSALDIKIRDIICSRAPEQKSMQLQALGVLVSRAPGAKLKDQPEKTWRAYMTSRSALYDLDPPGVGARVRVKSAAFETAEI